MDNITTYMVRAFVVEKNISQHFTVFQYDTGLTRIPKVARDEKTARKGDVAKDQEPTALLKVPVITNLMDETLLLAIVFLRQTQNHIDDDLDAEPYVDVNVI